MKPIAYTMAVPVAVVAAMACSSDPGDFFAEPERSGLTVARTDIVADGPGALTRDSMLVNAWGLAFHPSGVAWVSATESGVSAVYDANGRTMIPAVAIPSPAPAEPAAPTGQVHNPDPSAFYGDAFIVVSEGGTISGWQSTMGGQATERVDNTQRMAVYKGVTIVPTASGPRLLAADFRNGTIDAFDAGYAPVSRGGMFVDPGMPAGFAPFNVEALNGKVIVTYALRDENGEDDVAGPGNGYVDLFDVDGTLLGRLISGGELDSPWGVALAPPSFGAAPRSLLIGNFGDGRIHVYRHDLASDPPSVKLQGRLVDRTGAPLRIDGLWSLKFGPDAGGFSSGTLYFTAGPEDETHGTFGRIETRRATASPGTGGGASGGTGGRGSGTAY